MTILSVRCGICGGGVQGRTEGFSYKKEATERKTIKLQSGGTAEVSQKECEGKCPECQQTLTKVVTLHYKNVKLVVFDE